MKGYFNCQIYHVRSFIPSSNKIEYTHTVVAEIYECEIKLIQLTEEHTQSMTLF